MTGAKTKTTNDRPTESGLIAAAYRLGQSYLRNRLKDTGVNVGQADLLWVIVKNVGISQVRLAELAHVSTSAVTQAVASLEKQGFVIRKTSESDRRFKCLYPTEKAKAIESDLDAAFGSLINLHRSAIGKDNLASFRESITRVIEDLERD